MKLLKFIAIYSRRCLLAPAVKGKLSQIGALPYLSLTQRRCILSTTPKSISSEGTSGSCSSTLQSSSANSKETTMTTATIKKKKKEMTTTTTKKKKKKKEEVMMITAESRSSSSSSSYAVSWARNKEIVYLENKKQAMDAALLSLTKEIYLFIDKRGELYNLLGSSRNDLQFESIGKDIASMRENQIRIEEEIDKLNAQILKLTTEERAAQAWKYDQYSLKEFLVELYNRNGLDPIAFMDPTFDTFERIINPSYSYSDKNKDKAIDNDRDRDRDRDIDRDIDMTRDVDDSISQRFWRWTCFHSNRKEIFFIHGSPGSGKALRLLEIGRVPQETEEYSQCVCAGISFNLPTRKELKLIEQNPYDIGPIFVIPRLIYGLFVKDILWEDFSSAFTSAFSIDSMYLIVSRDVIPLLKARGKNDLQIILIIDGISKLNSDKFVESTRAFLCRLITNPNYSYCVFSSLYYKLINDTKTYETASGRQAVALGPLKRLDKRSCETFLKPYFNLNKFDIRNSSGRGGRRGIIEYSKEGNDKISQVIMNNFAVLSAGHPRSLVAIVCLLKGTVQ